MPKHIGTMTVSELKEIPIIIYDRFIYTREIFFRLTKRRHDSGFCCWESFVFIDDNYYRLGCCHDVLKLPDVNVDAYMNHVIRVFPRGYDWNNRFKIISRCSDFEVQVTTYQGD